MNIRAPNNDAVVNISPCCDTSGRSKTNPNSSIIAMENFRPTLSTIIADRTSPGNSANKFRKSCYLNNMFTVCKIPKRKYSFKTIQSFNTCQTGDEYVYIEARILSVSWKDCPWATGALFAAKLRSQQYNAIIRKGISKVHNP